jgi:hypothetical protein
MALSIIQCACIKDLQGRVSSLIPSTTLTDCIIRRLQVHLPLRSGVISPSRRKALLAQEGSTVESH